MSLFHVSLYYTTALSSLYVLRTADVKPWHPQARGWKKNYLLLVRLLFNVGVYRVFTDTFRLYKFELSEGLLQSLVW